MTEPTCPRCDRPIHDHAYVCSKCGTDLEKTLQHVSTLAGDINLTVAKLARVARPMSTERDPDIGKADYALYPMPLPLNLHAAQRHDAAVNALQTWARHIGEERGQLITGEGHPLAILTVWLVLQVHWLRHRQEADEAFDEIHQACRTIEHIIDRPAERVVVGRCPCGVYLYSRPGVPLVQCQGCGTSYDVARSRDSLRDDLEDRLLTAGQIATMAFYLGLHDSREGARKLINVWANRGRIAPHGTLEGDPTYRFGEILTRLLASRAAVA